MVKAKIVLVLFVLFNVGCTSAQKYSSSSKKAIKFFEQGSQLIRDRDFDNGQTMLKKSINADPEFVEALLKLGSVKKLFGEEKEAMELYGRACDLKPDDKTMGGAYFTAATMCFQQGEYEKAKKYYERTLKYPPSNLKSVEQAKKQLEICDFAIVAVANPVDFEPKILPRNINISTFQSYPCLTADNKYMIFTMRTPSGQGMAYDENIFISTRNADGKWMRPVSISKNINTKLNEGTSSISADGKTLVFTACNRPESFGKCDLYISYKKGDEWSEAENMGSTVNSADWESEPSLSADGRTLYFNSLRPGGQGSDDIWFTTKNKNGGWNVPKNLGPQVNTPEREVSPFIQADGSTLYFSSTGYPGMGGFDLFRTTLTDTGWSKPQNLGYPLNTQDNEASMFITADYDKGYYAKYEQLSPTEARSLLYTFDIPEQLKTVKKSSYASGKVFDAVTKTPLDASVELVNLSTGKTVQEVTSDSVNGEYLIILTTGSEYALWVRKSGYLTHSYNFDYSGADSFDPVGLDVFLNPLSEKIAVVLNNVFFETGKYDLQDKSKFELESYAKLLQDNPNIKIEIGGHTDNVGSTADNKLLSLNRAKSVYNFMVEKGISKSRMTYKGYGETKPVEPNDTEEGRKVNRRIEFKLL